ncbi:MAG: cupin domain-containing protein [Prevotella sp.]|nr:cupin domain-containing protein [Prevotella sp.]
MQNQEEFQMTTPYPIGKLNEGYAQYFIGNSYLAEIETEKGGPLNVTFEPRCRNNWHVHHGLNQVLVCVAGRGWYQEWGKESVELKPGTVIVIPKDVKHWHGAAKDSWMQHLTYFANTEEKTSTDWLEPVGDELYNELK